MKNTTPALLGCLCVALLAASGCSRSGEATSAPARPETRPAGAAAPALPKIGPAPAWQLKDMNGAPVTFAQFKGKVVVVDFWATWCPPCRAEIPGYIELMRRHGQEGLVIVGISLDQAGPDVVKAFAGKAGINYPIVMGDDAVVAAFGGVEGIPTTFLIDRQGQIRDRKVGAEETASYERKVIAVLREQG